MTSRSTTYEIVLLTDVGLETVNHLACSWTIRKKVQLGHLLPIVELRFWLWHSCHICRIYLVKLARDLVHTGAVAFWKGNPLISEKSRLVKYYNLARYINMIEPYNMPCVLWSIIWARCQMMFCRIWLFVVVCLQQICCLKSVLVLRKSIFRKENLL